MKAQVIIREATAEDLDEMKEIWKEFIDFHKDVDPFFQRTDDAHERFGEFVKKRIEDDEWRVCVAMIDDQIAGHIMAVIASHPPVFVNPRFGFIQDLAVRERFRRKRVGTMLFARIVTWFRENDVSRIELDAAANNETSQGFWRALGFTDFMTRLKKSI